MLKKKATAMLSTFPSLNFSDFHSFVQSFAVVVAVAAVAAVDAVAAMTAVAAMAAVARWSPWRPWPPLQPWQPWRPWRPWWPWPPRMVKYWIYGHIPIDWRIGNPNWQSDKGLAKARRMC